MLIELLTACLNSSIVGSSVHPIGMRALATRTYVASQYVPANVSKVCLECVPLAVPTSSEWACPSVCANPGYFNNSESEGRGRGWSKNATCPE
jgi:hypothetical protein